jgi:FcoT-like thioesterase domain
VNNTAALTGLPSDSETLAAVLRVYRPECRYVKSVILTDNGSLASGRAELAIPESFYIDDTGHFNAVEFTLCYNQIAYYVVAKSVKEGLMPPFDDWTPEEFWERQLSSFLIIDSRSRFHRPVDARRFYGEVEFTAVRTTVSSTTGVPLYFMHTACRFWDDAGGKCSGEVRLACVSPPAR